MSIFNFKLRIYENMFVMSETIDKICWALFLWPFIIFIFNFFNAKYNSLIFEGKLFWGKMFYRFVPTKFQAKHLIKRRLLGVKLCSLKWRQKKYFEDNLRFLGLVFMQNIISFISEIIDVV